MSKVEGRWQYGIMFPVHCSKVTSIVTYFDLGPPTSTACPELLACKG
jgi:hypothetical protein